MTIDDAIKRYTSNAFYEKSDGNLQGYLEFNQLAEWLTELKELKERTESCEKWIPVSERLPEHEGNFLVTLSIGDWSNLPNWVDIAFFYDKKFYKTSHKVVAWMPLPKPYEPQESEVEDAGTH